MSFGKTIFVSLSLISVLFLLYLNFGKEKKEFNKSIVYSESAPKPIGPYSQGVKAGNTIFISGQIALDPGTGRLDTSSVSAETNTIFKNISTILKAAGMTNENIIKTTVYMKDLKDFSEMNKEYEKQFKDKFPARETVQVSGLPNNANIEIAVIAIK